MSMKKSEPSRKKVECNVMRVMTHRNDQKNKKLSDEDVKQLADFFYLLWRCDERNKREGRYG